MIEREDSETERVSAREREERNMKKDNGRQKEIKSKVRMIEKEFSEKEWEREGAQFVVVPLRQKVL